MTLGTILKAFRRPAVSWLRMVIAVQIVIVGPIAAVGGIDIAAVYVPGAVLLATPAALLHRWICRKEPPYLRLGYWAVVLYGPAVMCVPAARGEWGWDDAAIYSSIYEVGALAVTAAYIVLWRVGDRWLGVAEQPRVGRRWACSLLLVAALGLWLPFVHRAGEADDCMDRGGRVLASGACDQG